MKKYAVIFSLIPMVAVAGGKTSIEAEAEQMQRQAQTQAQTQAANSDASNAVNVEGDQTRYHSTAWALALPPPGVAAPAASGRCLEHSRGWGVGIGGRTGGTKLNEACMQHLQCLDMADRYAAWGQVQLAMAQLQSCGAVKGDYAAPPVTTGLSKDEVLSLLNERDARREAKGMVK